MNHVLQCLSVISATVMLLGSGACDRASVPVPEDQQDPAGVGGPRPGLELASYATVIFNAAEGHRVSGSMQFMPEEGREGIHVIGRFANLPEGSHGLRILQSGDCSDITGLVSSPISAIESAVRDEGEAALPNGGFIANLSVGEGNMASLDLHVDQLILEGPGSIIGKPVIVGPRADEDPARPAQDPAGKSGGSIACGVITLNDVTAAEHEQGR